MFIWDLVFALIIFVPWCIISFSSNLIILNCAIIAVAIIIGGAFMFHIIAKILSSVSPSYRKYLEKKEEEEKNKYPDSFPMPLEEVIVPDWAKN